MSRFDLVIFDCDGVLIDSERLLVRVEVGILASLGWPLTETEIVDRFVGQSSSYMHKEIERHLGRTIDWEAEFETRYEEAYFAELVPVDGIANTLDAIECGKCVASNGSHDSMRLTLGLTGLLDRFPGRIFSANDVAFAKPAPDLFLHAARMMGVHPQRCAVVEDSVAGVTAGVAAEMTVFGFSGSVTSAELLTSAGAFAFAKMSKLPELLQQS
jgi:HAD superfamily hydrolase (TIGR01509 family)